MLPPAENGKGDPKASLCHRHLTSPGSAPDFLRALLELEFQQHGLRRPPCGDGLRPGK